MAVKRKKIVVAVTGASGSIYAKRMIENLMEVREQLADVGLVFSDNARDVWEAELGPWDWSRVPFRVYDRRDFYAPFASGSARYDAMVIVPCSMGTLARIAQGVSADLITRAADVMLKERRRLVLVPRDTPLNLIHLRNMTAVTEAGAIIAPAMPSYYSRPQSFDELADTVVHRVLDLIGIDRPGVYRWGEGEDESLPDEER